MESSLIKNEFINSSIVSLEETTSTTNSNKSVYPYIIKNESETNNPLPSLRVIQANDDIYLLLQPYFIMGNEKTYSGLNSSALLTYELPTKEKITMIKSKEFSKKIINLFNIIGKDLFDKLSFDDLVLMANTAGAIDLGESVDINRMYSYLDQN